MTTRKELEARIDGLKLAFPDYAAKSRKRASAADIPMASMDVGPAIRRRGEPRDLTGLSDGSPLPEWTREGSAFDPSAGFADMRSAPKRGQVIHPKVKRAEVWPKTTPLAIPGLDEFRPVRSAPRKRSGYSTQSAGW